MTRQASSSGIFAVSLLDIGRAALASEAMAARVHRRASPAGAHIVAARRLNRAAGLLAFSVLLDSAVEHYRGSFQNRAMVVPLVTAAMTLAASAHGTGDNRAGAHRLRDAIYGLSAAVGVTGTGFHLYNITKRPGGFSWLNLFYAAPIGAPMALSLAGLLGACAERLRDAKAAAPKLFGLSAGKLIAAVTAAGLLGTVGEAGLLHFRGAYQNPVMFAPVSVPPVAAALLAATAAGAVPPNSRLTRWWLRLTAVLGFAGVGFHAYGVQRSMGGWRNWSQNLLSGPPLPAPPSFSALALAGLAALDLLGEQDG